MVNKTKIDKEFFEKVVKESFSFADVCRKLGWKPQSGNYRVIHRYVKEYMVDTSHFLSQRSNIGGRKYTKYKNEITDVLKENSYYNTRQLKWRLINSGLKEYKCELCGCSDWNGGQIVLQLHHINGDHSDNRLENLQLLCPNCHSQTDTYGGRKLNKKIDKIHLCKSCYKKMEKTPTGFCDECYKKIINHEINLTNANICPITICEKTNECIDCGKKINRDAIRCEECYRKNVRKTIWPSKEKLNELILNNSFSDIAKQFGVSETAIRKWCIHYGLPHTKKELNKMGV